MVTVAALSKIFAAQSAGKASKQVFSFSYFAKDGSIVKSDNAIITSSNYHRRTVNVKFPESEQIRTLRLISFYQYNGERVCP